MNMKMKKIKKMLSREDGNIIVLFAGSLVLIFFMVGILLDLGMIYMRRNDLMDMCQLAREKRMTHQNLIRYSENPAETTYKIIAKSIRENGFQGTIEFYFDETSSDWSDRNYKVAMRLSENYNYTFLKLFGASSTVISTYVEGGESYGERIDDMIWHSSIPSNMYSGTYTGTDPKQPEVYAFTQGAFPKSWTQ